MLKKRTPSFQTLAALLLTGALLLGACDAQAAAELQTEIQAEAETALETQPETGAAADAGAYAEQSAGAEAETEADASAEAQAEVEAEAQVGAEAYPELVLGSADFHATDPATVNLASGQIQFIEFFAYWCSTCKAMAPHVHGLEQIYGDRVNFVYLDRDDPATADLRSELGYVYQPHIFILDGEGNILFQSVYFTDALVLQEAIETALANN